MAVGDFIGTVSLVNPNSTLTVQPGAGVEWIIHNIYASSTVDVKVLNASGTITIEDNLNSCLTGYFFHASNSQYYHIVNTTGDTITVGYDGVQSK